MFRSMLYVRYGSGCSRRVTASAAAPKAARSCVSSSRTPSAEVSRSPAAAFSSNGAISEDKVDSSRSQGMFHGKLIEPFEAAPFRHPQPVVQVVFEISDCHLLVQIEQRRLASADFVQARYAQLAGRRQGLRHPVECRAP